MLGSKQSSLASAYWRIPIQTTKSRASNKKTLFVHKTKNIQFNNKTMRQKGPKLGIADFQTSPIYNYSLTALSRRAECIITK